MVAHRASPAERSSLWARTTVTSQAAEAGTLLGDVEVFDVSGICVLELRDIQCVTVNNGMQVVASSLVRAVNWVDSVESLPVDLLHRAPGLPHTLRDHQAVSHGQRHWIVFATPGSADAQHLMASLAHRGEAAFSMNANAFSTPSSVEASQRVPQVGQRATHFVFIVERPAPTSTTLEDQIPAAFELVQGIAGFLNATRDMDDSALPAHVLILTWAVRNESCASNVTHCDLLPALTQGIAVNLKAEYPTVMLQCVGLGASDMASAELLHRVLQANRPIVRIIDDTTVQVQQLMDPVLAGAAVAPFCPDGSLWYVVTGAFGGIGRLVVAHLARSGCKKIVMFARGESSVDHALLQTLQNDHKACTFKVVTVNLGMATPRELAAVIPLPVGGGVSPCRYNAGCLVDIVQCCRSAYRTGGESDGGT